MKTKNLAFVLFLVLCLSQIADTKKIRSNSQNDKKSTDKTKPPATYFNFAQKDKALNTKKIRSNSQNDKKSTDDPRHPLSYTFVQKNEALNTKKIGWTIPKIKKRRCSTPISCICERLEISESESTNPYYSRFCKK